MKNQTINFLLTVCLTFLFFFSNAQDILIKTNGENVLVKVEKITDTNIEYKLFNNIDGPTYSINRKEVFQIQYKNGTIENINANIVKPTIETPIGNSGNTKQFKSGEKVYYTFKTDLYGTRQKKATIKYLSGETAKIQFYNGGVLIVKEVPVSDLIKIPK